MLFKIAFRSIDFLALTFTSRLTLYLFSFDCSLLLIPLLVAGLQSRTNSSSSGWDNSQCVIEIAVSVKSCSPAAAAAATQLQRSLRVSVSQWTCLLRLYNPLPCTCTRTGTFTHDCTDDCRHCARTCTADLLSVDARPSVDSSSSSSGSSGRRVVKSAKWRRSMPYVT